MTAITYAGIRPADIMNDAAHAGEIQKFIDSGRYGHAALHLQSLQAPDSPFRFVGGQGVLRVTDLNDKPLLNINTTVQGMTSIVGHSEEKGHNVIVEDPGKLRRIEQNLGTMLLSLAKMDLSDGTAAERAGYELDATLRDHGAQSVASKAGRMNGPGQSISNGPS